MNALQEKLFLELRQTKLELEQSLQTKHSDGWLTDILTDELADVSKALTKLEHGRFGLCELTGELLPVLILENIPTLKTIKETGDLSRFCKKPISLPLFMM